MGRRLRFKGEFTNKVDGKGRVSIPAPFRRVLQEGDPDWTEGLNPRMVIVYGIPKKPYLECYTVRAHEELEDEISQLPAGAERRALERIYSTQTAEVALDETGRIVLSARLREKAGVDGEAYFASNLDKFQIWSPEVFEQTELSRVEEFFDDQGPDFDPLELLARARVG